MAAPAEDCAAPLGEINYLLRAVELRPCPVPLPCFGPRHSSAFPCALPEVQISPPFFAAVVVFNEAQERAGRQAKQSSGPARTSARASKEGAQAFSLPRLAVPPCCAALPACVPLVTRHL